MQFLRLGFLTSLIIHSLVSVESFAPSTIGNRSYRRNKADEMVVRLDGEGMAGSTFNKHILGDILRALQPQYLSQVKESISGNLKGPMTLDVEPLLEYVENASDADAPPSWTDLEKRLKSQQSPAEKGFRKRLEDGLEHSALATQRQFSGSEHISVTFYKDAASWCPYCQKVWIALEEKQISYKVVTVDMNCYAGSSKPPMFLNIQPSGSLPCVVIDDGTKETVIGESDEILAKIDKLRASPNGKNLLPDESSEEMEYMKFLCDDGRNSLERRLYSEWMWYLTGKRRPVEYKERYEAMLDEVESVLSKSSGCFFMGKDFSMADIKFIPFVERQAATLFYLKGLEVRDASKWPNLVKWLEEMEKRPSYQATKSDYYTHSRALPPQISAECTFSPDDAFIPAKNAVDAYCLPTSDGLDVEATPWTEPGWPNANKSHRREAAERIIYNRKNIVKFASRAAGKPGLPAAAAPLADPRAEGNDAAQTAVDIFLRLTVSGLLQSDSWFKSVGAGAGAGDGGTIEAAKVLASCDTETSLAVIACLDYLRQRIGVPRDMSYPAAQELRKELLNVSSIIQSESEVSLGVAMTMQ